MIEFQADHRTNGLTHITVTHQGQEAGGFTLPTPVFDGVLKGLQTAGPVEQTCHGEPITRPEAKKRTRRRQTLEIVPAEVPPAE